MTVALATVWLAVAAAGVVGAVTPRPLRLSHDQYSPASPSRREVQQADWRDHDPAKDQPLDLWIGSRRSILAEGKSDSGCHTRRNKSAYFVDLALRERDSTIDVAEESSTRELDYVLPVLRRSSFFYLPK